MVIDVFMVRLAVIAIIAVEHNSCNNCIGYNGHNSLNVLNTYNDIHFSIGSIKVYRLQLALVVLTKKAELS